MKLKKALFTTIIGVLSATQTTAQTISILEGTTPIRIQQTQTQTQINPGWKIVDLQLPSRTQRYLWGQHAKDTPITDGRRPQLVITTDSLLLGDMVLIRLKTRSEYRLIPKPDVHDCKKVFCDLQNFSIQPYHTAVSTTDNPEADESTFLVQPLQDMEPGEYILTWLTAPTVGQYHDWTVWPLSIR